MSDELVHLEVAGGVATITLDSPANRNALSRALMSGLEASLEAALNDDRARLIVLTHTGPVFCSGADLKEMRGGGPPGQPAGPGGLVTILKTIWRSPKPVIARIGGPTRAGGIGLIAACDMAVAVEDATFAFSEVRLGLIPAIISVVVLPMPADQLDETVAGYVASVLKGAPGALSGCKRLVREVPGMTLDDAFAQTSEWTAEYFGSEEALEGMTAFAQKRPPRWSEGK